MPKKKSRKETKRLAAIREWLEIQAENFPELSKMDGFDDCILGICHSAGREPFIVYDRDRVLTHLMRDGMDGVSAQEYHEFNQACAYVGPHTPGFIDLVPQ
jgi:hypothetical protein